MLQHITQLITTEQNKEMMRLPSRKEVKGVFFEEKMERVHMALMVFLEKKLSKVVGILLVTISQDWSGFLLWEQFSQIYYAHQLGTSPLEGGGENFLKYEANAY